MRHFLLSYLVTIAALAIAFCWAGWQGLLVCGLMIVMEVSFSFDNAVVNATVLREMSAKWQLRFLTWGMVLSVFGMYYLFPLLIVSVATGLGLPEVMHIAIHDPKTYSQHLMQSHTQIATFGGMFLLMVFLNFIMDDCKELHWLGGIEKKLASLGRLESVEIIIALGLLLALQAVLPETQRLSAMLAGVCGIGLYIVIQSAMGFLGVANPEQHMHGYSSLMGFIYLNILDASFSLDAVVGSFAISNDIVIIVLGLSAGAMFVRSLTLHLVRKGTLEQYVFLEHGAHYGIGALAVIMLVSLTVPVSQIITGLVGIAFILLSLYSSVRYNRKR